MKSLSDRSLVFVASMALLLQILACNFGSSIPEEEA